MLSIFCVLEMLCILEMLMNILEMFRKMKPALRHFQPSESVFGINLSPLNASYRFFPTRVRRSHRPRSLKVGPKI